MFLRTSTFAVTNATRPGICTSWPRPCALRASGATASLLEGYRDLLPTLFIVSEVDLRAAPEGTDGLEVIVEKAAGVKCERCWRWVPAIRTEPDLAGLCERCVGALATGVGS